MHDRMFGTTYSERVLPAFRRGFEQEFLSVDGRTIGIRSSMTGLTIPAMTSILSDAAVIWQLAPIFPDLVRGLWETVRNEWVHLPEQGPVDIEMRGWDKIDTGNYRPVPATALAAITWAAKEMGDTELARRLLTDADAILDPVIESGVKHYRRASTLSTAALLGATAAKTCESCFVQVTRPAGGRSRSPICCPSNATTSAARSPTSSWRAATAARSSTSIWAAVSS
jgi:hypothetical protein